MTDEMTPKDVVLGFWRAMETNDFFAAAQWLADDFKQVWPQSGEVIRGREAFGRINTDYPAEGVWRFDLKRILADRDQVVTEVRVTDGDLDATVVTFHTVHGDKITHQHEYWPDPFPAPAWRAQWVTVERAER